MLSLKQEETLLILRITSKQACFTFEKSLFNRFFLHSQDGTSEEFIGEWAEKRGIRDQLVIATKVRKLSNFNIELVD